MFERNIREHEEPVRFLDIFSGQKLDAMTGLPVEEGFDHTSG